MADITLIIHGWSDCSQSFRKLKDHLIQQGIGSVETIYYADYESREDNLSFNDVVDGLHDQFIAHGFIDRQGRKLHDLNVIVHSTGGLVIRHWIWRYYYNGQPRLEDCPVQRLVMLAPANFGSPLAHRGKSFLGALFKGRWKIGDFLEVGRQLLDGLELASPYQWELAHRDLFVPQPYYNAQQIQTTVLVGIEDYHGVRGWVDKPGTDGTVVIAGTSLDTAKLVLDFSKPRDPALPYTPSDWQVTNPPEEFAFGVLEGLDHGSIVDAVSTPAPSLAAALLIEALTTPGLEEFRAFVEKIETITAQTYANTHKPAYQQFLVHAVDDQGESIRDFTIEFSVLRAIKQGEAGIITTPRLSAKERDLSEAAQAILTTDFHTHSRDSSYRRFLVDIHAIQQLLTDAQQTFGSDAVLSMKVYVPRIDQGIRYDTTSLQHIVLYDTGNQDPDLPSFFYDNTTTLVELRVNRYNTYVRIGQQPRRH